MNYQQIINSEPFILGELTNSLGQKIRFAEHPRLGDTHPVILLFDEEQKAITSEFYEIDDMIAEHKEYEPKLINNRIYYGNEI